MKLNKRNIPSGENPYFYPISFYRIVFWLYLFHLGQESLNQSIQIVHMRYAIVREF